MTTLTVHDVSHTYGKGQAAVAALCGVDFEASIGELVAVVGPSGCGKSTLLSVIGQVLVPTSGQIMIDGKAVPASDVARTRLRNSTFGYLFQDFALVEEDTAAANVEVPLRYAPGISRATRRQRVISALAAAGVGDCAGRSVRLLSGGQRQRVALARALVNQAKIILADEPTGALDTVNGELVFELLKAQAQAERLVIVVTHNLDLALACDRVIALRDGHMVATDEAVPRRALRR